LTAADLKLPDTCTSGPLQVEQAPGKDLPISLKAIISKKVCYQTGAIKDRMGVITAVSFLSD